MSFDTQFTTDSAASGVHSEYLAINFVDTTGKLAAARAAAPLDYKTSAKAEARFDGGAWTPLTMYGAKLGEGWISKYASFAAAALGRMEVRGTVTVEKVACPVATFEAPILKVAYPQGPVRIEQTTPSQLLLVNLFDQTLERRQSFQTSQERVLVDFASASPGASRQSTIAKLPYPFRSSDPYYGLFVPASGSMGCYRDIPDDGIGEIVKLPCVLEFVSFRVDRPAALYRLGTIEFVAPATSAPTASVNTPPSSSKGSATAQLKVGSACTKSQVNKTVKSGSIKLRCTLNKKSKRYVWTKI